MPECYEQAAVRHYDDAVRLAGDGRYDGAGHLVGFAAECAIKHALGIAEPQNGELRVHLPDLAAAARRRFAGRNARQNPMRNLLEATRGGFLSDWNVSFRYFQDGQVGQAQFEVWEKMAKRSLAAANLRR